MKTVSKTIEANLRERGSKFISFVFYCETEDDFVKELDQIKSKYPDATHHCYAWRIDPNNMKEFSSDDGEPSGTAGLPILNQLKSAELVNTGAVVVRYFGGTKLGKSGLIESYGLAINLCINSAELVNIIPVQIFEIEYPYSEENFISKLKNNYNLTILESEYLESVKLRIACLKEEAKAFESEVAKVEHLGISYEKLEESFL